MMDLPLGLYSCSASIEFARICLIRRWPTAVWWVGDGMHRQDIRLNGITVRTGGNSSSGVMATVEKYAPVVVQR